MFNGGIITVRVEVFYSDRSNVAIKHLISQDILSNLENYMGFCGWAGVFTSEVGAGRVRYAKSPIRQDNAAICSFPVRIYLKRNIGFF